MPKTSLASTTSLRSEIAGIAAFEPTVHPVVSLYLNLRPDERGRDNYETFVRKSFAERLKGFPVRSPERESFERDSDRIRTYLAEQLDRSANALAIFACAAAQDYFKALQLEAPLEEHWMFIGSAPHLYPLVRLIDQYPRYAAVMLDTNRARIFVFGLAAVERAAEVTGEKTRRTSVGGWSQANFQRRVGNTHLHHIKEVVEVLDRLVTSEQIPHIIVVGGDVAVPIFLEQLPKHLAEKLVDVIRLDRSAGEDEILNATLQVLRDKDAETDAEHVEALITAWRGGGLGVAGAESTLTALQRGQVDELLIAGTAAALKPVQWLPDAGPGTMQIDTSAPQTAGDERRLQLAEELITQAQHTSATIRFIENADLLREIGGVGALLRFRV